MEAVRRANPKFTNFKSNTAVDAVEQFCRMQRNGLSAQVIPEALIECARGLNDAQMDLFEQWIVNPEGELSAVDLTQVDRENELLRQRLCAEAEARDRKIEMPEIKEDYCDEKSPEPSEFEMISSER